LEYAGHLALRDRSEHAVARQAPREGRERRVEPVEHVANVVVRPRAPHVSAVAQGAPPQQPPVLGQQHPLLRGRLLEELVVGGIVAVGGVQAEQPQAARQGAEVDVEREPGG
jgi:hypothetical protein